MKALPAILTNSEDELKKQISMLMPFFKKYQVDMCDGKFVPNTTLSVAQIKSALSTIDSEELKPCSFDFDLMVNDYKRVIEDLEELHTMIHIQNIFIHVSALEGNSLPVSNNFTIGMAIDPSDLIDDLSHHYDLKSLLVIQIMTVVPGFQGSPFKPEALQKIDQLKQLGYRNKIYIDGSVNDKTIPILISYKTPPDFLGVGSFLSKASDVKQRVEYLKSLDLL